MTRKIKPRMTRREFVARTGLVAGGAVCHLAGLSLRPCQAESWINGGMPRRLLGRTGVSVSTLTLGTAPCGLCDSIGVRDIADLVDAALNLGVDSIDTARGYGNAEEGIGLALGRRRREVFLATKVCADSVAGADASLTASLKALKTDCVDLLYWDNLGAQTAAEAMADHGVLSWLCEQKQSGKTRLIGVCGHNLSERFRPLIETDKLDVIMMVLNFVDRHVYDFERVILPLAREHGLGIVAMKVFGGMQGGFRGYAGPKAMPQMSEDHLELAVRDALDIPGVATLNLGVLNAGQIRRNVEMVRSYRPLDAEEQLRLARLGRRLAPHWRPHFGPAPHADDNTA